MCRKLTGDQKPDSDRVPVKVLSSGGGWSLLEEGKIAVGDNVRVSP